MPLPVPYLTLAPLCSSSSGVCRCISWLAEKQSLQRLLGFPQGLPFVNHHLNVVDGFESLGDTKLSRAYAPGRVPIAERSQVGQKASLYEAKKVKIWLSHPDQHHWNPNLGPALKLGLGRERLVDGLAEAMMYPKEIDLVGFGWLLKAGAPAKPWSWNLAILAQTLSFFR